MKNRVIRAFSVLCILVLTISYVSQTQEESQGAYLSTSSTAGIVSAAVVNMEATSSTSSTAGTAGIVSASVVDMDALLADVEDSDVVVTGYTPTYGYTNLGICIADGNLNIREAADIDSSLVGKLPENAGCEIIRTEGDWTYISSGEVEGYVSSEYLLTGEEAIAKAAEVVEYTATVTADVLRVRVSPDINSEVLSTVSKGEQLEVVSEDGEWVHVSIDSEDCYVSAEYVTCEYMLRDALTMTEARFGEGVSDVRASLVTYALQFVGNPYVWGGTSLTKGADCSGFVLSVFAQYGISLPHSSSAQSGYGRRVSTSELQPGDLIFYGSGRSISHVAIYIGNGQIVHASSRRTGIKVSSAYYRTPICCVSLLD